MSDYFDPFDVPSDDPYVTENDPHRLVVWAIDENLGTPMMHYDTEWPDWSRQHLNLDGTVKEPW